MEPLNQYSLGKLKNIFYFFSLSVFYRYIFTLPKKTDIIKKQKKNHEMKCFNTVFITKRVL